MAGDTIDVFGKSYYFQNTTGSSGNSPLPVLDLLTAFLGSPAFPGSGSHGLTPGNLNTPAGIVGILSLIGQQDNQSAAAPTKTRAFINVIFFDEQFKSHQFRASMVGTPNAVKDHYAELQKIVAGKSGYVYIYCSNESPVDVFFDNLQVVHTRGRILEETHYYPFGLTMAGISSKALQFGGAENRFKYNGIEQNNDFDLNMYDAFYRNLDPQIGRFWQPDPETEYLESYSPYESMGNNPVSNIDPLGNFRTRFGAWWHSLWNGGDVGKNQFGEYYVIKSEDGGEEKGPTVTISYGKGRDKYSNAREALLRDYKIIDDIRQNGEKSMYQMYDSPEEAGNAALSLGTSVILSDPIIKSGTIAVNTAQAAKNAKNTIKKLLNAGSKLDKGDLSAAGRALQKHGDRPGSIFPKATGNASAINAQGERILKEIVSNPSVTSVTRHHARLGNILEYKLPSGQGARFSADGRKFFGFIEP